MQGRLSFPGAGNITRLHSTPDLLGGTGQQTPGVLSPVTASPQQKSPVKLNASPFDVNLAKIWASAQTYQGSDKPTSPVPIRTSQSPPSTARSPSWNKKNGKWMKDSSQLQLESPKQVPVNTLPTNLSEGRIQAARSESKAFDPILKKHGLHFSATGTYMKYTLTATKSQIEELESQIEEIEEQIELHQTLLQT